MKTITVEEIKTLLSLKTNKKTSNLLEGSFRSIFHGRSMDFDDLREYTYGDDVHDIDWKASSRTGQTLVRKNMAEKKHFLLIIGDAGNKMDANTSAREMKSELAVKTMGILARIANVSGIDYALLQPSSKGFDLTSFQSSEAHLSNLLSLYQTNIEKPTTCTTSMLLQHALEHIHKRMLIVLITDLAGMKDLDETLLKDAEEKNDLFVIEIEDAYLTDSHAFDINQNQYTHQSILKTNILKEKEKLFRKNLQEELFQKFSSCGVNAISIADEEHFIERIVELFSKGQ